MSRRQKQLAGWLVLFAVVLCLQPAFSFAGASAKSEKKSTDKHPVKGSPSHRRVSRHYRRRSNFRYRLAKMRPSEDRITEIQQALIREGYLKQEATGKWDDATRSAMRNYQQANGFNVTGLPEAKALMKLGLGPHPLPEDADPTVAGQASINPPAKTDSPTPTNSADPPNNHNPR
jgi:peptidoglycan hydrolase-like protein with peptidoglycan-binding domain